jgi:putative hydrolase
VNWDRTKQLTRQLVAQAGPDPSPSAAGARDTADAIRLAQTWLDQAGVATAESQSAAWSRAEWVEAAMPALRQITEPIVTNFADALFAMNAGDDLPPEIAQLQSMMAPMIRASAGTMYAGHLAQAMAKLATEVLSGTDSGLPLIEANRIALLPGNITAFGEGLGQSLDDVLLFCALRETARQRLFTNVAWLSGQILALLEHYAREIVIDSEALRDTVDFGSPESMTPQKLAEASEQLQGKLFAPTRTPEQAGVLERLETLLALTEGWVDTVTAEAAAPWLTNLTALTESMRRRRAVAGPGETFLKSLVGLELRPKRVRDAANLWAMLSKERGPQGRDAVWHHPDLIPTPADLDDPIGFVKGESAHQAEDQIDADLRRLLDGWDSTES